MNIERKERLTNGPFTQLRLAVAAVIPQPVWDAVNSCGHPALGAFTALLIFHVNTVAGILGFLGFLWYESREFREIQRIIRQGKIPSADLGDVTDSCAMDTRDYLRGFYVWAILETVREAFIWISGLF